MSTAGDDRARLDVAPAVLTSPDGLVRVTVGANGALGRLEFAPDAFERTTPAQLAYTVQALVQQLAEAPLADGQPQQMPAPRPTPRRVRPRSVPPRSALPQNRRRGS
ncbi:hypothetical protein [Amycolatopsis sp. FDAARGOS 1241]|uniref:hypothetical protein n=1 Tax=Amycolatopsis sp. FDAARGOS 1241 TaxID=2778070 RepID=UPI001951DA00|nr:hypothetical protein [Amycolatopsis sp. FDAARGOS 1241]QRP46089.1 hypothetical protein I6J71_44780 [Amycolatopsis sp. FDAARGOS 1241]